jgi:hypothetical protein
MSSKVFCRPPQASGRISHKSDFPPGPRAGPLEASDIGQITHFQSFAHSLHKSSLFPQWNKKQRPHFLQLTHSCNTLCKRANPQPTYFHRVAHSLTKTPGVGGTLPAAISVVSPERLQSFSNTKSYSIPLVLAAALRLRVAQVGPPRLRAVPTARRNNRSGRPEAFPGPGQSVPAAARLTAEVAGHMVSARILKLSPRLLEGFSAAGKRRKPAWQTRNESRRNGTNSLTKMEEQQ